MIEGKGLRATKESQQTSEWDRVLISTDMVICPRSTFEGATPKLALGVLENTNGRQ